MSALLIIGAGGNGRVISDIASSLNRWERIQFLDDAPDSDKQDPRFPVIGCCDDLETAIEAFDDVVVGFGDNTMRSHWSERARICGRDLTTIIAPTAVVSDRATLGPGSVVMSHAVVNAGVVTGSSALINTAATVDHDCLLGDCVHISPGANLGGTVHVGDRSWLGIGCSVRHSIRIESDVVVGAGAVVVCDVRDSVTVVGVPARVVPVG